MNMTFADIYDILTTQNSFAMSHRITCCNSNLQVPIAVDFSITTRSSKYLIKYRKQERKDFHIRS